MVKYSGALSIGTLEIKKLHSRPDHLNVTVETLDCRRSQDNGLAMGDLAKSKPFLKWAGGKRWLADHPLFNIPNYPGRYLEPFLGGGAIYFSHCPANAILSDLNSRLIEVYRAIQSDWSGVWAALQRHQQKHSKDYYYFQRDHNESDPILNASRFLYLNRACWNGLYRENLAGRFNVPIGTKSQIIFENDNFELASSLLSGASIRCCDFEETVDRADNGDFLFVDPPYTVAHNTNGFVKYNEKIFSWDDQLRLKSAIQRAIHRGVYVALTNADHPSIRSLYEGVMESLPIHRASVISGSNKGRVSTSELLMTSFDAMGVA
ncbi:Dam family site-specific DNA-(adenine-N6)-methyltransferase [Mesorhizobium sp. M1338]|uniref:DNA adenine methylase n=1 Tax=unclassified Mesorhizobium TaxID=325217 RepID=UPI00333941D0